MSMKEIPVEEREFTEEETKNQTRLFEEVFINGLIEAVGYKTADPMPIEIIRNGKLYFKFHILPLGESEYDKCKSKHTKYVRNKQLGIKIPEDTDTVKYRCALIYQSTIQEDRTKLWDNKKIWGVLNDKGLQVMNGLDVIEFSLMAGEKDRIIDAIDKISGYDSNLEEVAKN